MSTAPMAFQRNSWMRPKYLLFALMVAYVLGHNERFLIDSRDPEWPFNPLSGGCCRMDTLLHALCSWAIAVLGSPAPALHKAPSSCRKRFYVAGVFIAAPLGSYIQYFEERMGGARSFSVAAAADAFLWMVSTAIAMGFILMGKVHQHRQWMTRSFAVALVFLEVRFIGGVTGWDKRGTFDETIV